jgi:hypothetical protein
VGNKTTYKFHRKYRQDHSSNEKGRKILHFENVFSYKGSIRSESVTTYNRTKMYTRFLSWSRLYDRDFQRQRCKNLQRIAYCVLEIKLISSTYIHSLEKTLKPINYNAGVVVVNWEVVVLAPDQHICVQPHGENIPYNRV